MSVVIFIKGEIIVLAAAKRNTLFFIFVRGKQIVNPFKLTLNTLTL